MPALHIAYISGLEVDFTTTADPVLANNLLTFTEAVTLKAWTVRFETVLQYSVV